ncbi:LacI family transcriptional regulator [Aquibacillus koreensis]|uniref:LacI family transcriptional regulator n=1 Tax=Aquibacillus koreensis TaxID=279446 RepID=A0A9X3WQ26_9BACI|nr:LacI family DNA-binding transcriptional regulator [Aquibacillus koreensis]MCT2536690.1 LacI family transcriptional regulator [Aquibacillus koreensis]MDC3422643.1 LacI family transcriptional regulator [Aquibacillus koreensis]
MHFTINDIAKMAGVSRATVSKVMNNYHGVNEKTKQKVLEVIQATGYSPTFSAKSLATKKSNLIGVIYAGKIDVDFTHPFFNQVISSFKKEVGSLGYDILMFSNEQFKQDNGSYLARCRHFSVDGCLIISGDDIESTIGELVQSEIPCVGIDIELEGSKSSFVTTDNELLSSRVVEHLHGNGLKKIAYIGVEHDSYVAIHRKKGFFNSMIHFGLSLVERWIESGDYFAESGYQAMKRILAHDDYPDAVYAISDLMALGAMEAILDHGLRVPEDIAVVGCDDIEACQFSSPKLTSIKQDKESIGRLSAHMLQELMTKESVNPCFVEPKLVVRQSCGRALNVGKA